VVFGAFEVEPVVRAGTGSPRLLFVATVAVTIRHFLRPYADHFRSLGWHVEAAANGLVDDPASERAFDAVHDLPLSRSIRDVGGLVRGWRAVGTAIRAARPDIVHVHTPIASFLVRLTVRRMPAGERPRVVYTAHGFHFHAAGRWHTNAVFRLAERVAGRWTDRLVVINDEDEAAARRLRLVPPDHLVHMPGIGLDTMAYDPASVDAKAVAHYRQALGLDASTPYFVVVGEFSRNKRQADAIDALARLAHPEAVLVLVGSGPGRPALEVLAQARDVADRVRFTGLIDNVPAVLVGAVALVATSKREGLSRSVMEALALEVPVIASTARGNAELVGEDGRMFATGDVAALARWMDWFLDHRDDATAMGRAGRRRMVEVYDLGALFRRHERLYDELLAERRSRPVG
jgi:glycosyltransferase involved in cell wall biosynthesis